MGQRTSTYLRQNILGLVALFVALGGVSDAAGLKPNSVKSKHIKNGQVKNADLGARAVSASKIAVPLALSGRSATTVRGVTSGRTSAVSPV